jgi:hypothetical protein
MAHIKKEIAFDVTRVEAVTILRRFCLSVGKFVESDGVYTISEGQNGFSAFGVGKGVGGGGLGFYTDKTYWPATVTISLKDNSILVDTYVFGIGSNTTHCENVSSTMIAGIEQAFDDYKMEKTQSKVVTPVIPKQVSDFDELLGFKKLLDEGVITKEEFELKKREILNLPKTEK